MCVNGKRIKQKVVEFVVLRHIREGQKPHYDLMLELSGIEGKLTTYNMSVSPREMMSGQTADCKQIFDHDRKFLTYEGSVNGGMGSVERIDYGKALIINADPFKCEFEGCILKGVFSIIDGYKGQIQFE